MSGDAENERRLNEEVSKALVEEKAARVKAEAERDAAQARVAEFEAALRLASAAMDHMGDALNNMDACEPEDEEDTELAFATVRSALGEALEHDAETIEKHRTATSGGP